MKNKLIETFNKILDNASNKQDLIDKKNIFIKNEITPLTLKIKQATIEQKKELGKMINELKNEINQIFENKISEYELKESNTNFDINDFILDNKEIDEGKIHILNKEINHIKSYFDQLNFSFINGEEIVDEQFNFTNLNIPKNHPARNLHDSLFISDELLLRTHCTSNTANVILNNNDEDIRIVSCGNVYRRDDDDATHSHQFMQIDFVWIKKGINLSNLKWVVNNFLKFYFGDNTTTRYRLSFFPFTEPSFEVDVSCFKCNSKGCNICKNTGWIEVMGAGLLHPNVLSKSNINSKQGIAGGIGIERLVMLKYGISDIRDLYSNYLEINKQF